MSKFTKILPKYLTNCFTLIRKLLKNGKSGIFFPLSPPLPHPLANSFFGGEDYVTTEMFYV
jgi:hypothetical protein